MQLELLVKPGYNYYEKKSRETLPQETQGAVVAVAAVVAVVEREKAEETLQNPDELLTFGDYDNFEESSFLQDEEILKSLVAPKRSISGTESLPTTAVTATTATTAPCVSGDKAPNIQKTYEDKESFSKVSDESQNKVGDNNAPDLPFIISRFFKGYASREHSKILAELQGQLSMTNQEAELNIKDLLAQGYLKLLIGTRNHYELIGLAANT